MSKENNSAEHTKLVSDAVEFLRKQPEGFFRKNATGVAKHRGNLYRYGYPGSPDIEGVFRGRSIGIECKTGSARLNSNQKRYKPVFEQNGGLYFVVRCYGDVLMLFDELVQKIPVPKPLPITYGESTDDQLCLHLYG